VVDDNILPQTKKYFNHSPRQSLETRLDYLTTMGEMQACFIHEKIFIVISSLELAFRFVRFGSQFQLFLHPLVSFLADSTFNDCV
jgi:hypothetical protein